MVAPPTTLEYALLGLLREKAQSGYDLRKMFATTPMRHFSDSPGSIYPALRRLRERGWIRPDASPRGARRRQVFRITAAGKQALLAWLRRPVIREDIIWGSEDLALRFAFFDGNFGRRHAVRFLAEMERELAAYIAELERYAVATGVLATVSTGGLAFAGGIEGYKGQLSWARRARRKLEAS